jgi:hypothetical protein
MTTQNLMLEAALRYASWGWPVLPLQPNSKIPATAHGVHDATTDPEQIAKWWGRDPSMNIGVAAGKASGLLVFDVDPRNGGEAGWEDWVAANGPHPDGSTQLTAGGGYHFLGQYTDAMRSCKLATGVDLLSDGRYFVVSPSTIDGRSYEWEGSSDPHDGIGPFPVPKRWLDAYQGRRTETQQRTPDTILQGGRNEGLLSAGGTMRNAGFSEEEILSALLVMNERRCDPPLPETEVRRVAKSASRYEPARDVAGDMARGTVAAESILRPEPENDFLNRLDDVDAQPAPMRWLIKPWLPEQGLCMIHGPSGSGKTFVLMNWLLHIATEMQEWNGGKVATGPIIYLAGEGHYGLRARSRGWKAFHRISESLIFISTHGIDLNTAEGWNQVVSSIEAATPDASPCAIAIDTLNRHMRGDENSAQDAKSMIDAMDRLQRLYGCLVINNHHTGNSDEAQHRARGSSAWRAAMDIEISITPGKRDRPGKITMKKSKDTELAAPVFFKLQQIDVPGWYDDEGQPVTTAIPVVVEGAAEEEEERGEGRRDRERVSKHAEFIRLMERGWFAGGAEIKDDLPYIKREALKEMLLGDDRTERTVTNDLTPSRGNALIGFLLNSETITKTDGGWLMRDATVISQWSMKTGR